MIHCSVISCIATYYSVMVSPFSTSIWDFFVYTVRFTRVVTYDINGTFYFMCYSSALPEMTVTLRTLYNHPKVTALLCEIKFYRQ